MQTTMPTKLKVKEAISMKCWGDMRAPRVAVCCGEWYQESGIPRRADREEAHGQAARCRDGARFLVRRARTRPVVSQGSGAGRGHRRALRRAARGRRQRRALALAGDPPGAAGRGDRTRRSEEHTSELQSRPHLV